MEKFNVLPLGQNPVQNYLNDRMQLGEVLEQILQQTGPADIVVSTFSTAEEFLTKVHRLRSKGLISSAILYTDHKAAEKTAKILTMVRNVFDEVYFVRNHSKIMIIKGYAYNVVVLTSQNQTRGNRLESYTIFADNCYLSDIEGVLEQLPKYELPWTQNTTTI